MKKLLIIAVLLLALPAWAGSYTLTTTTTQDNVLARTVSRTNAATCRYYGLPVGCTQPQARRAFCRAANLGDVATCEGANQVDIYADVASFLQREVVRLVRETYGPQAQADDAAAAKAAFESMTVAQKNAQCAALGLAAGCNPWP